jgi:WS/DGAT/MGAT family acyltransferase
MLGRLRSLAEPGAVRAAVRDVGSAVDAIAGFVKEPISALPFHGRLGNDRRMLWRSFPLAEFESLRVAGDCTINDALLTVIAGAVRSYLDDEGVCPDDVRVRILVPVSVRDPRDSGELGNVITALFPRLPVDEEDPLERLRRVREEMQTLKGREMGRATGVLLGLLGAIPSAVEAAALRFVPDTPLVSFAVTNVRGPSSHLTLLGRRIIEVHPIMNLFHGVGLAFAVASYAGRMSVCASTDPSLLPEGERLVDAIEAAVYELRTEHWRSSKALRLARGLAERVTVGDLRARARAAAARQGHKLPGEPRDVDRVRQLDDARVLEDEDLRFAREPQAIDPAPAPVVAGAEEELSVKPDGDVHRWLV